jgi:cobalt-zinc-cadmium efflux system outer membrane protein
MRKPLAWRHAAALLPTLFLSALFVLPACAVAQADKALCLADAVELALTRHPELASARHALEAAQGATEQSGALPNPDLSSSLEDTRSATRTTAVQLSQKLELGGKRGARIEAARWSQEIAQADLDARRAQLRAAVQAAFWDAVAASARLELARQSDALASQAVDVAAKRVAAGKVSPVEETRARLALSGVALASSQAAQDVRDARTRLAVLIGMGEADVPALQGVIDKPVEGWAAANVQQRLQRAPDVVRAEIEVRRRDALVAVERSKQVPDVTVGLGAQRNNGLGRNQALLSVSLPIPVFDRNQGGLKEALALADQARDELAAVRARVSSDVMVASTQLDSARGQALLIEQQMLPDAQRNYEAATTGFSLGKFGFLDVLDAQRTLFQARSQHLRALADAQHAAAELARLLGGASTD